LIPLPFGENYAGKEHDEGGGGKEEEKEEEKNIGRREEVKEGEEKDLEEE
jgi:hypothetical protein